MSKEVKEIVDLGNFIYQTLKDEDVKDKAFITDILSEAIIKAGYHLSPPSVVGDLRIRIASEIEVNTLRNFNGEVISQPTSLKLADSILALIDIDKMAREAGYVKPSILQKTKHQTPFDEVRIVGTDLNGNPLIKRAGGK